MNIRLKGIRKSFGSVPVLRDIDLELGSGRFTTLLGPSGCGKTTLLRIVAGLERPDGGEVYFDDELHSFPTRRSSDHRKSVV